MLTNKRKSNDDDNNKNGKARNYKVDGRIINYEANCMCLDDQCDHRGATPKSCTAQKRMEELFEDAVRLVCLLDNEMMALLHKITKMHFSLHFCYLV